MAKSTRNEDGTYTITMSPEEAQALQALVEFVDLDSAPSYTFDEYDRAMHAFIVYGDFRKGLPD